MIAANDLPRSSVEEARSPKLLRLFFAFFVVLSLMLVLNGGLTLGAMHKVQFESTSAAARVVGHDWALRIQGAIRFGKPIEQFYGLEETLAEIQKDLPTVATVAVTNAEGQVLSARGEPPMQSDLAEAIQRSRSGPAGSTPKLNQRYYLIFPIKGRDGQVTGALAMTINEGTILEALRPQLEHNLWVLAMVAVGASISLLVGVMAFNPLRNNRQSTGWRVYALPLVVMLVAQGIYTWDSIETFRNQYLGTVKDTTEISVTRLARDLNRLFDKGVKIERLVGIEAPFQRVMDKVGEIHFMEIRARDDRVLYRLYRDGRLERQPATIALLPTFDLTEDIHRSDNGVRILLGSLRLRLDEQTIAAGVRQRLFDSGTVALVSALFVVELFMLLAVLMRQQQTPYKHISQSGEAVLTPEDGSYLFGRPSAFLLLFAWALPLSFIPLRMREIYTPIADLAETVVLALPLSVEMLCALLATLLAGVLTDRRGWQTPFLIGVGVTIAGELFSMFAGDVWSFILARAVVGAGYGLSWMGIQGFIFLWATPQTIARGIAHLVAGIFAGYICGSAVGAMLAQQIGYTPVFGISAVLSILPGGFVLILMRRFFGKPVSLLTASQPSRNLDLGSTVRLLGDRNFFWLQFGSVAPFSLVQVGLLYFALPLFLTDQGINQGTIGRVMMIYWLTVIYLGPFLSRYIDAAQNKKTFIVLGGLIGSSGMIYLYFDKSLYAIMLAVFALGLASSLAGAAQSAFALNLKSVIAAGAGKSMSVQRAADKLGQMIGPLLIGALFTSMGAASGLAITGVIYLVATLLFWAIAHSQVVKITAQGIPFFHSIKTRIFLAVTLVVSVVAGVVMTSSRHTLEHDSVMAEERSLRNVLKLVEDNVQGRYRSLLKDKVATVQAVKQQFREFDEVMQTALDGFASLADLRVINDAKAQELALQWLATVRPVGGEFLLVFDQEHRVLISPVASQQGYTLIDVVDIKGRSLARAARDEITRFNNTFLSFMWPDASADWIAERPLPSLSFMWPAPSGGATPKFGYFVGYQRWGWVIGTVGDVGRVEVEAQRQLTQLRTELADTLPHIVTSGNAAAFIFDGKGNIVVPPRDSTYLGAMTSDVRIGLMQLARQQMMGEDRLRFTTPEGEELEGHATYIKPFDWYIAALASRDALREPARKLVTDQAGVFLIALAVGLILAYFFAYRIALPLNRLSAYAVKLPESDFSANDSSGSSPTELPVGRRDEIGRLAQAFVFMKDSLHANVCKLMQAVAARERIEGELNVARDIQMDLLPKVFPAFPNRAEVDIHAVLTPAREIGGDLYNFYFLDDHHLCFTIGDVSGKGVPAALFMTIAMTLIRVASERESDPARIMDDVNDALSRDNPNCMFVTLVVGVVDVRSGRMVYVNAGHNPPLLLRQEVAVEVLSARSGPAAGVTEGVKFRVLETALAPGDCLLLYTDGVTEAMNPAGDLYSDERLRQIVAHRPGFTPEQIINQIMSDVRTHAGEADQSDDITMLAIRYCGPVQAGENG